MEDGFSGVRWRKSSHSGGGNDCVGRVRRRRRRAARLEGPRRGCVPAARVGLAGAAGRGADRRPPAGLRDREKTPYPR